MKKILGIYILVFFLLNNNVLAEIMKCSDKINNEIIIDFDYEKIEASGKIFTDIFVFGNGMSGEYFKYKSIFLGLGKKLDEKWEIDIELNNPKTVTLSKFKYYADELKKVSDNYYICQ